MPKRWAQGSGCTVELWASKVPVVPLALELAMDGIIPAGAYRNMDFAQDDVELAGEVVRERLDCLYDPQTAGGLLLSVAEARAEELLRRMADSGVTAAAIGRVLPRGDRWLRITP